MKRELARDSTLGLVRLLQLASPMLPIGAYSYSQGLEWAVAAGALSDAATARTWIGDALELVVAPGEAAVTWRLLDAAQREDWSQVAEWNDWFRASRETAELRAETEQMGASLLRLAFGLELLDAPASAAARAFAPITLPGAYALIARGFEVPAAAALADLGARIPAVVARARSLAAEDVTTFAPGITLASTRHETQYSRLFRS